MIKKLELTSIKILLHDTAYSTGLVDINMAFLPKNSYLEKSTIVVLHQDLTISILTLLCKTIYFLAQLFRAAPLVWSRAQCS